MTDDCDAGLGLDFMATDHSWEFGNDSFKNHMKELLVSHETHVDFLESQINEPGKRGLILKKLFRRSFTKDIQEKAYVVIEENL